MFWRTVFGCLLAATIVMASGCVAMHPTACGVGPIGDACGVEGCDSCLEGPAVGCHPRPMLGCLHNALTCGSGCDEVYYGEWINHPPKYCASCDYDGNWVGAGPCAAPCWHPFQGLRNLWGYRFGSVDYGLDCTAGCSSCEVDGMEYGPVEYLPEEDGSYELPAPAVPEPTPDRTDGASNGRQASRRVMPGGQVTHATYHQRR
jgi:hypothetical protein